MPPVTEKRTTPLPNSSYIDFVKALAIIMVVAFHSFGQLSGWHLKVVYSDWFLGFLGQLSVLNILKFIEAYFYLGVNIFVITSGFGLYYSYLKGGAVFNFVAFLKKRVFKLIPAAIFATILVFFFKGFFLGTWATSNWYLNLFPFMAGLNLFSDNWFFPPIDGEMWFLGLIIQLYLLFPILIWLHKKVGKKWLLAILFTVSVLFRIIYYIYFKDSISSMSYGFSLGRIFEFGFGMMVAADLFENKKPCRLWILGLLAFAGYFFPYSFPFADSLTGIGAFMLVSFLGQGLYLTKYSTNIKKIFSFLSEQSYMVFLIHHPFIWLINKWGISDFWNVTGLFVFILLLIASFGIAYLCNQLLKFLTSISKK